MRRTIFKTFKSSVGKRQSLIKPWVGSTRVNPIVFHFERPQRRVQPISRRILAITAPAASCSSEAHFQAPRSDRALIRARQAPYPATLWARHGAKHRGLEDSFVATPEAMVIGCRTHQFGYSRYPDQVEQIPAVPSARGLAGQPAVCKYSGVLDHAPRKIAATGGYWRIERQRSL